MLGSSLGQQGDARAGLGARLHRGGRVVRGWDGGGSGGGGLWGQGCSHAHTWREEGLFRGTETNQSRLRGGFSGIF